MAILIKNTGSVPECDINNLDKISNRRIEENTDINKIRQEVLSFHGLITSSTDPFIKNLKKASSFPVEDIMRILQETPNCKYLRVYNAIEEDGNYTMYLAPISESFNDFLITNPNSVISQCCCQCNPCTNDTILNPVV